MSTTNYREEALNREAAKAMFPARPGYGVAGRPFAAVGNNYEILTLPTEPFYHYDVDITTRPTDQGVSPKAVPKRLYKRIMVNAMTRNPQIFTKRGSFDGNRNLYVPFSLGIPPGQTRSLAAGLDGEDNKNPDPFTVKLTRVGKIDVKRLAQLVLSGQTISNPRAREQALRDMSSAVMVLNAVVQMVGKELYRDEAGRKSTVYFRPRKEMPSGVSWLELWQGYYQSIRPKLHHLTVNIDVTHGLMFSEGPLLDLVISHLKARDTRELTPNAIGSTSKLERLLKGLLVIIKRNQTNCSRAKPIVAIEVSARDYMFNNRHGEHVSVEGYYRQTYHTTIRYPTIICVAVGNTRTRTVVPNTSTRTVVPLELCHVVPGQLFKGTAPREVMQTVIKAVTQKPRVRLDAVKQAYRDLQYKNSDFIRQSGMVIDNAPMKIAGRRLKPPVLWCAERGTQSIEVAEDGSFTLSGKNFFKPGKVDTLGVLCFFGPRDKPEHTGRSVYEFVKRLCARLKSHGVIGDGLDMGGAFYIRQASQGGNVRGYAAEVVNQLKGKPSLLLAILPGTFDAEHVAVKRAGDVEMGIPTQVVLTEKVVGSGLPKDDYLRNLALKINMKLGGINWVLGRASLPGYIKEKIPITVIIGADVSHPPPGNLTNPSICGVVATLDETLVKYCGVSSVQVGGARVEVIEGLKAMLKPIFWRFRKEHAKDWPAQVIYYRDGVGESQLAEVTRVEKQAIMEALREVQLEMNESHAPKPMLTFVVVSKRHHQRFFPDHGDRNGNCYAGSVFDEGVASPTLFDFYLQSHAAIQGTARPSHYVVTHNENPLFNADSLQRFTNDLCHTYGRATRAVSIPPPVYYADLLCRRGKFMFPPGLDFDDAASAASGQGAAAALQFYQSQYARVHESLRDKMYFV